MTPKIPKGWRRVTREPVKVGDMFWGVSSKEWYTVHPVYVNSGCKVRHMPFLIRRKARRAR